MTFPYKIKVNRCVGGCNNFTNPYSKVCIPDIVKNISVKVFDLISQQSELREIRFHKSCKCDFLLMKQYVMTNRGGIKMNVDVNV